MRARFAVGAFIAVVMVAAAGAASAADYAIGRSGVVGGYVTGGVRAPQLLVSTMSRACMCARTGPRRGRAGIIIRSPARSRKSGVTSVSRPCAQCRRRRNPSIANGRPFRFIRRRGK